MMGGVERDKKFVSKILDQLRGERKIYAVDDKWGSPTYTLDFSKLILSLMRTPYYGTYHAACKGKCTRYDVAKEILKISKRPDIELVRVNSDFFRNEYPAARPTSEMLRNYKLELRGMNSMPDWRDALHRYLRRWFAER